MSQQPHPHDETERPMETPYTQSEEEHRKAVNLVIWIIVLIVFALPISMSVSSICLLLQAVEAFSEPGKSIQNMEMMEESLAGFFRLGKT